MKPDDKYKLENLCLKSLKDSLASLKVKLWAILDRCPQDWENLFRKYFDKDEVKIIKLEKVGEINSWELAIEILINQNFSEIVYLAEDDYFYLPNQFIKMIKFLSNNSDVDFIKPYDHLDNYKLALHKYQSLIKVYVGKHWRTVSTTCGTFLTTRKALYQTKDVFLRGKTVKNFFTKDIFTRNTFFRYFFRYFVAKTRDSDMWLSITKCKVFNFFKIIRYRVQNHNVYNYFFRAWRYHWKQILFGKKWKLWSPIPSIATHLEKNHLAPTIDWKKKFKEEIKNLS